MRMMPLAAAMMAILVGACSSGLEELPPVSADTSKFSPQYRIGPLDGLQIFVWRNPELSRSVAVRPDGQISVPLIEDLPATGKTPTELAREIEKALQVYVQDPIVTVIMGGFNGPFQDQVRVVGEAGQPQALPYRDTMTLLDVMIAVGGLTEFASGNRATITRVGAEGERTYRVRLDDLVRNGDISANVAMRPGDILIIPESWF